MHQLLAGLFGTALNSRLRAFAVEETAPKYDQVAVYLERIGGLFVDEGGVVGSEFRGTSVR